MSGIFLSDRIGVFGRFQHPWITSFSFPLQLELFGLFLWGKHLQYALAKQILNKHGLDYVGEFIVGWRDMHHVIDVLYDRTNPEETKRADACFNELLDEFEKRGYAVYRVNTRFMDRVAQSYGPVKRRLEHTLKKALDPNNILAPGKSGIDLDKFNDW